MSKSCRHMSQFGRLLRLSRQMATQVAESRASQAPDSKRARSVEPRGWAHSIAHLAEIRVSKKHEILTESILEGSMYFLRTKGERKGGLNNSADSQRSVSPKLVS